MSTTAKFIYDDNTTVYSKFVDNKSRTNYTITSDNKEKVKDFFSTEVAELDYMNAYKVANGFVVSNCIKNMYSLSEKNKELIKEIMGFCLLSWCFKIQDKVEFTPIKKFFNTTADTAYVDVPKHSGGHFRILLVRIDESDKHNYSLAISLDKDFTDVDIRNFLKLAKKNGL